MSTVCYCGQSDCPVTTWEHDACIANLRAERDALQKALADAVAIAREFDARQQKAEAQVEAARKRCRDILSREDTLEDAYVDAALTIVDAMDEAAR